MSYIRRMRVFLHPNTFKVIGLFLVHNDTQRKKYHFIKHYPYYYDMTQKNSIENIDTINIILTVCSSNLIVDTCLSMTHSSSSFFISKYNVICIKKNKETTFTYPLKYLFMIIRKILV